MHRSDETGGTRAPRSGVNEGDALRPEKVTTSSLRDRIRQAGTAAARVSDLPPAPPASGYPAASAASTAEGTRDQVAAQAGAPKASLSGPPEHSGVRSMPAAKAKAGVSQRAATADLFAPNQEPTLRPPPLPREAMSGVSLPPPPRVPGAQTPTRMGLGVPQIPPPPPSSQRASAPKLSAQPWPAPAQPSKKAAASTQHSRAVLPPPSAAHVPAHPSTSQSDITTARTQPLPKVAEHPGPASSRSRPTVNVAPGLPAERSRFLDKAPAKSPVPGLLRTREPATPQMGRYSVHDVSAEYIETRPRSTPPTAAGPVDLLPGAAAEKRVLDERAIEARIRDERARDERVARERAAEARAAEELTARTRVPEARVRASEPLGSRPIVIEERMSDVDALRARRATPKERPGRRRATRVVRHDAHHAHDTEDASAWSARARYARSEREDPSGVQSLDEAELGETIHLDMLADDAESASTTSSPQGREPRVSSVPPPLRTSSEKRVIALPAEMPTPAARARESKPTRPLHTKPAARQDADPTIAAAESLPAVMVDPAMRAQSFPPKRSSDAPARERPSSPAPSARASSPEPSTYEPLPNDRESFEEFMRARLSDPNRMKPEWVEQDTQLIARDSMLSGAPAAKVMLSSSRLRNVVIVSMVLVGLVVAVLWTRKKQTDRIAAAQASATADAAEPARVSAPAAQPMTVMVTEPSGAEIVQGGAVIGNTPAEVPRPRDHEETYLLRMNGFESQLVRLSPPGRDVIHVTLRPLGFIQQAPAPIDPTAP